MTNYTIFLVLAEDIASIGWMEKMDQLLIPNNQGIDGIVRYMKHF
jgi:hypothetical protein